MMKTLAAYLKHRVDKKIIKEISNGFENGRMFILFLKMANTVRMHIIYKINFSMINLLTKELYI